MHTDHQFEIQFCESILKRCPDDIETIEMLANFYTKSGRIADGLRLDERLVLLAPANPTNHYNLACSLSLSHRYEDALNALRKALDKGYCDFRWIREDPDLKNLQSDPRFHRLLDEFKTTKH